VAKFIEFENDGETVYGKPEYLVKSKSGGNVLARIVWYPRWQQWVCEPAPNTIWSQDCLADMREYMLSLANGGLDRNREERTNSSGNRDNYEPQLEPTKSPVEGDR
jgi:hypothetical protein